MATLFVVLFSTLLLLLFILLSCGDYCVHLICITYWLCAYSIGVLVHSQPIFFFIIKVQIELLRQQIYSPQPKQMFIS